MKAKRVSEKIVRRKNMIVVRIILLAGILSAVVLVSFFSYKAIHRYLFASSSVSAMYDNWGLHSRQGYEKVYEISENIIQKRISTILHVLFAVTVPLCWPSTKQTMQSHRLILTKPYTISELPFRTAARMLCRR